MQQKYLQVFVKWGKAGEYNAIEQHFPPDSGDKRTITDFYHCLCATRICHRK